MALKPTDLAHAAQIAAGTKGRKSGHDFEDRIAAEINTLPYPFVLPPAAGGNVRTGDPAKLLLGHVAAALGYARVQSATAVPTGSLATADGGGQRINIRGIDIRRCKSDIVLALQGPGDASATVGISTKNCNKAKPTNAQLYFTTAGRFADILATHGLTVSQAAVRAMRQFCGDEGFRPMDDPAVMAARPRSDPRRFYWEETDPVGRAEWQRLFTHHQDDVTRILLKTAYANDPFPPSFLLHKTKAALSWATTEVAIYGIDELVGLSRDRASFSTPDYKVNKGTYRDGLSHQAVRFGVVQMQRAGSAQHPTQLQFNLEAGYFYKLRT